MINEIKEKYKQLKEFKEDENKQLSTKRIKTAE
jgi:hypothetical protein